MSETRKPEITTWYEINYSLIGTGIRELRVVRETEKTLFVLNARDGVLRRQIKDKYMFRTWEEARAALLAHHKQVVISMHRNVEEREAHVFKLLHLQPPKEKPADQ